MKKIFLLLLFFPFFAFSQVKLVNHEATKIYPNDTRITYLELTSFSVEPSFLQFVKTEVLTNTAILRFDLSKDGKTCFFESHKEVTEKMIIDAINDAIEKFELNLEEKLR